MTVQTWRPVLSRGPMPPVVRVVCGVLLAGWTLLRVRGQGPGNPFYAASAWSATKDAQAWFFGSVDPQSTITIDKPPLLIWVLGASCRLFGFSAASLVLTQTAIGVCATVLVYLIGRRVTGWVPASIGAGVFLLTPVNALVFGYTNPDVELTALACAALYAAVRAVQERSTWWTAAVGASLGLAFLTKMLQGLVIVPALTVGLFLALPGLRARLYAIGAAAAGAAAPVVLYLLGWSVPWPHRPYIGGSPNDSFLGLVLGYNGLSRVVGRSAPVVTAPVATAPTPPASSAVPTMDIGPGVAGPARLLLGEFGQEVGAAVLLGVVCLAVLARPACWARWRRDPGAMLLLATSATWFVSYGALLSGMRGIIHPYYATLLTPAIALLVAQALEPAVASPGDATHLRRADRLRASTWMLTLAGSLLMVPAWFTATTTTHYGVNPSIRQAPQTQDPWSTGDAAHRYPPAFTARLSNDATSWPAVLNGARQAADLQLAIRRPVLPLGGFNGYDPAPTLRSFQTQVATGNVHYYIPATGRGANPAPDPWWDPGRHGPSQAQAIDSWIRHTYRPTQVDGVEVYDLAHAPRR